MMTLDLLEYKDFHGPECSPIFWRSDGIGVKAPLSDVAIITGAETGDFMKYYTNEGELKGRTGEYFLKDKWDSFNNRLGIDRKGHNTTYPVYWRDICARTCLKFERIDEFTDVVRDIKDIGEGFKQGTLYVPLYAAKEEQDTLLKLLDDGKLKPLDPSIVTFPTDLYGSRGGRHRLRIKNNSYYEFQDNLYVLLEFTNGHYDVNGVQLTNGKKYKDKNKVFVKVSGMPVFTDFKKNQDGLYKAYYSPLLFAGIPFNHTSDFDGDFEKTDMRQYLNRYWEELEKLQFVVLKNKSKTKPGFVESQMYAQKFMDLLAKYYSLDETMEALNIRLAQNKVALDKLQAKRLPTKEVEAEIKALQKELQDAERDKFATNSRIQAIRTVMNGGETPGER